MLSGPDGFILFGKHGVDFFSTSELLYPNKKIRFRRIRARPIFYIFSDNPDISIGIFDYSFYTRRNTLEDDDHKKRKDMLAIAIVKFIFLETPATTSIFLARQNQFIHKNNVNNAPARRIVIPMNTNSAIIGLYIENPIWYEQPNLRRIRRLTVCQ